jgi:hypothetical protein
MLFAAGAAGAQNLVVNGSFEQPAFGANSVNGPSTIPGWTSTGGFEVWNQFQGPAADGVQYLELDTNTCTTISQTISTTLLQNYTVSLDFAARNGIADNRIEVLWNGVVIGTASADGSNQSGNVVWTPHGFAAVGASGSSTLAIRNVDTCDGQGSLLDNVAVVAVTPLPMLGSLGLALLAGGLMLLALVILRRRPV